MAPAFNSVVVSLSEVPREDVPFVNTVRGKIVLVVDDEHLVADTLSTIFKFAGFCAFAAYDAKGALELASAVRPDILVSDVDMPGMTGVELAMALLAMMPECRVLLFSGHATYADLAAARAAGHDFPLLSKPVHPAVMLKSVAKCLDSPPAVARMHPHGDVPRILQTA
jgi:DNA-binding NtrC family response regulator